MSVLTEWAESVADAIRRKTNRPALIKPIDFAPEIDSIITDILDTPDSVLRNELIFRGYDVPKYKSNAYYKSVAESRGYHVIQNVIKEEGQYPYFEISDFVNFNSAEYTAEFKGYIKYSNVGTTAIFGTRLNAQTNAPKFDMVRNMSGRAFRYANNGLNISSANVNEDWHVVQLTDEIIVDGMSIARGTITSDLQSEYPLLIFATNTGGTVNNNLGECGIEYLKFFHQEELVYYFFPVLIDNEICLYDVINDNVYYAYGTGRLTTTDPDVDVDSLIRLESRMIYYPSSDD